MVCLLKFRLPGPAPRSSHLVGNLQLNKGNGAPGVTGVRPTLGGHCQPSGRLHPRGPSKEASVNSQRTNEKRALKPCKKEFRAREQEADFWGQQASRKFQCPFLMPSTHSNLGGP